MSGQAVEKEEKKPPPRRKEEMMKIWLEILLGDSMFYVQRS